MVHDISTFCYVGDHRLDKNSRLKLPPEVLSAFRTSNQRNLRGGEFRVEKTDLSLNVTYGDKIVMVVLNAAEKPESFSIDDLVYVSTGVLESQIPLFDANEPNVVFLYSMTEAVMKMYQNNPSSGKPESPGSQETASRPESFRLVRVDSQDRILLKPFELAIAEGPERYTRIEGYQQLSCFTLRRSDYAGRGVFIQTSSSPEAQPHQHPPRF